MPLARKSEAEVFWSFSLAVYDQPGVAKACLELQDRLGLDVNLLLFGLYCGARGCVLSSSALRRLDGAVEEWRREVVEPLRAVRRRLKSEPEDAPQELRARVLDLEIEAERLAQARLAAVLAPPEGPPVPRTAAGNLRRLLKLRGLVQDEAATVALATLMQGTFPDLPPLLTVWYLLP